MNHCTVSSRRLKHPDWHCPAQQQRPRLEDSTSKLADSDMARPARPPGELRDTAASLASSRTRSVGGVCGGEGREGREGGKRGREDGEKTAASDQVRNSIYQITFANVLRRIMQCQTLCAMLACTLRISIVGREIHLARDLLKSYDLIEHIDLTKQMSTVMCAHVSGQARRPWRVWGVCPLPAL